ncbi:type II secretion system F family protein [Clostridium sp. C2-6-12]|uniref:type II secretion system F family protein n=1 Tax=Clostridium sp. C2-6-12 TaxID=2698832 RepID=UPI001367DAB7|nr:type II secretion system F family protein [Clostridium sp. C2-6-12]
MHNYVKNQTKNKKINFSIMKERNLFKPRVNEEQLVLIAGNLAQLYKNGIPIAAALELVSDISYNKVYKESLHKVLNCIKQGNSLSEGFSQFNTLYPRFFTGIIAIGEHTGKLYSVLKGLNAYYSKSIFIKKEIKNASIYPLFILLSMFILSIFFINNIIPSFCEIYKAMNIGLPANCKAIYEFNNNLKENPLMSITTMVCWSLILLIVLKYFFKKVGIDKFAKVSIVKLFFEYIMVLFFSIITSSGINISKGLKHCEDSITFIYLQNKIKNINENILGGRTLTDALEISGVFSKYTLAIIKVNEEGGTIEEGFKGLSVHLEYQLSEQIKKYLRLISPIFVFIMAAFIVIFLVGFVLPLFDNLKSGIR